MTQDDLPPNDPTYEAPRPQEMVSDNTDDSKTDEAVEQIERHESDEVLAAEDAKHAAIPRKAWYKRLMANKKLTIPAAIVVMVVALMAIPFTRYKLAGLVWKQSFTVSVIDQQTNQPVSEASVSLAGHTFTTNNQGKVTAKIAAGSHLLSVTQQYYRDNAQYVIVPIMHQKHPVIVYLVATGRQVPVTVVNKISGSAATNILVTAAGTQARTDKAGKVTIVLPADKSTVSAKLTGAGYNDLSVTITVSAAAVPANSFQIVPAGTIYFLSNLSGKIDVVKTNLDGSDRQTVLAGTGNEDNQNTVLLASRDWKYLALLTKRTAGGNAELDLIDTATDQLTNIDQGDVGFALVGWSNDKFIYTISRNSVASWQPNQQALKSFDAATKKTTTLDQTTASGTGSNDYIQQRFGGTYIIGSSVLYIKNWYGSYSVDNMQKIQADSATLNSINNDGSSQKVIKSFSLAPGSQYLGVSVGSRLYKPADLYLQFSDGTGSHYYEYTNGQVTAAPASVTDATFYQTSYPTYLLSPGGDQTFWAESRDGKNTLLVGDQDASGQKQIATLSDYSPYGWYTNNYLLVQKDGSELYIMPAAGGTALKLTDYYKSAQNFYGYGGL